LKVVIDTNLLFWILISQGDIVSLVFNEKLRIFAPLRLKEEFNKHKKEIFSKCKSPGSFEKLVEMIFNRIIFVALEEYLEHLTKSRDILREHRKDEDFLALALFKKCKVWTYESRFFKLGYAVSTKQVSERLSKIE